MNTGVSMNASDSQIVSCGVETQIYSVADLNAYIMTQNRQSITIVTEVSLIATVHNFALWSEYNIIETKSMLHTSLACPS